MGRPANELVLFLGCLIWRNRRQEDIKKKFHEKKYLENFHTVFLKKNKNKLLKKLQEEIHEIITLLKNPPLRF